MKLPDLNTSSTVGQIWWKDLEAKSECVSSCYFYAPTL